MKNYLVLILFFMGIGTFFKASSQPVEVDLNSKTFKAKLPFDEEFNIAVKLDKDNEIFGIQFNYRIKNRKPWHYFPDKASIFPDDSTNPAYKKDSVGYLLKAAYATKLNKDETTYTFPCGPLHPNTVYQFSFKTKKRFNLTDDEKIKLKSRIGELILLRFKNSAEIDTVLLNRTFDEILAIVQSVKKDPFQTIELANGGQFLLKDPTDRQALAAVFGKTSIATLNINALVGNIDATGITDSLTLHGTSIITHIDRLLNDTSVLDKKSQYLLKQPIDQSIEDFKTVNGLDFLLLLKTLIADNKLVDLLKGKIKIRGSGYSSSKDFDGPSYDLLFGFMHKINVHRLTLKTGVEDQLGVKLSGLFFQINNIYTRYTTRYLPELEKRSKALSNIPDLTLNLLLTATYTIEENTEIELAVQKTPYIGLDAGLGYSFGLENYFIYYGVNFYLRPVNKKMRLSRYKGWDRVFKTVSLFAGVTNNKLGPGGNNNRYEASLGGSNDFLFGLGYRFNRAMRLNTGMQFYFLKDQNPFVDKKKIQVSPIASLTIDLDIIKNLGKISSFLKLAD